MKNNFLTAEGIDTLIQKEIQNPDNGKLNCINIQKNIAKKLNLEKAIYDELNRIGIKSSDVFIQKNILKNENTVSFIAKTKDNVVLRLFFDNRNFGYENAVDRKSVV